MEIEENTPTLQYGTIVKMNAACKEGLIKNDCKEHVDEFGECFGVVEDLVDFNNVDKTHGDYDFNKVGPEHNVRWYPSGLRYGYTDDKLDVQKKLHINEFLENLDETDMIKSLQDFYTWQETSVWDKGNVIEQINTIYVVPLEGTNSVSGRITAYHFVCGELAKRLVQNKLKK